MQSKTKSFMKTEYRDIKDFNYYYKNLINEKKSFELIQTKYTKKIKENNKSIIFNEGGINDTILLPLINKVRNDAKSYKLKNNRNEIIDYFRLYFDPNEFVCVKIDLSSAYWTAALKMGVISDNTNDFFNKQFQNKSKEYTKKARLKALGSIATTKLKEKYEKGILIESSIKTEGTKDIYIQINKEIDNLMKNATSYFETSVYYYFDCIFCAKKQENDVIEFFKQYGYKSKNQGETILKVIDINEKKYIISEDDEKAYIIKKEDEFLIKNKIKEKINEPLLLINEPKIFINEPKIRI